MYIMANISRNLYVGMTNDLTRRVQQHKEGVIPGYTKRYKIRKLVYYATFSNPRDAIAAEKKVKGWLRAKKIALIESENPSWRDLARDVGDG